MRTENLVPVDFTKVRLADGFWANRMKTNREVTIEAQYRNLKSCGSIDGIDPAFKPGDRSAHHIFWDSDVAKWMESASYSLAVHPDSELERKLDEVIARFARLQRPDGYLNSWYTAVEPNLRWTNLRDCHELYCAGHLMEAAVAHFRATGKRHFIDIMCRYADLIGRTFGREEGKKRGYCGHPEIELALVKLFRATGNERYLALSRYFIDERGSQPHYYDIEARTRGEDPAKYGFQTYEYCQAHLPLREQRTVGGHAVRAMYIYSAMADIARETGDPQLASACNALWDDLVTKKLYITGGVGASGRNEGFTFAYDLPEETAYCESCAAIGLALWAHRMVHLEGDGRFTDVMERALYNGVASGLSLSGDKFFYGNPLASVGTYHRSQWFGCACCPGNLSRLLASIGQYLYSAGPQTAFVHLYAEGSAELEVAGTAVTLEQKTRYPWDGLVELSVAPAKSTTLTLALRIPAWCRKASLAVNGKAVDAASISTKGYARVSRTWEEGDKVRLELAMPVERIWANPAVRMANGKVALQRGPVVYCLEETDNRIAPLSRISLPREARLSAQYRGDLLGGISVISAQGNAIHGDDGGGKLYRADPAKRRPFPLVAVPYCVWDNREPGQMLVWIRES